MANTKPLDLGNGDVAAFCLISVQSQPGSIASVNHRRKLFASSISAVAFSISRRRRRRRIKQVDRDRMGTCPSGESMRVCFSLVCASASLLKLTGLLLWVSAAHADRDVMSPRQSFSVPKKKRSAKDTGPPASNKSQQRISQLFFFN